MTALVFATGAALGVFLTWACMVHHKTSAGFWRDQCTKQRAETEKWFAQYLDAAYGRLEDLRERIR